MKLEEFNTDTYVRRPFQVQAFEITQDNIAELAPHVGELCDDNGTPFIKSDKKKVGNNFKVWPGFFATVLKGHVRCYSRKTFFEQFGELNDKTSPAVEFLHGRASLDEMLSVYSTDNTDKGEPDQEEAEPVVELLDAEETAEETGSFPVAEDGPTCEHGTPLDQECVYKTCKGGEEDDDDLSEQEGLLGETDTQDAPEPSEGNTTVEKYRSALEGVIKS